MTNRKALGLALLAALALSGCDKAVTAGNANAPGSPGTGNPTVVAAPVAADTPAVGAPGTDTVPGTTGRTWRQSVARHRHCRRPGRQLGPGHDRQLPSHWRQCQRRGQRQPQPDDQEFDRQVAGRCRQRGVALA
jgi:hypothetical protein